MNPRAATTRSSRLRGFTLIEMLVVVGVISLLLSIMLLVGSGALNDARVKDTTVLIGQLENAIEAFRGEQVYIRVGEARRRFGDAPPDDLMSFTPAPAYGSSSVADPPMPNLMPARCAKYINLDVVGFGDDIRSAYVPNGDIKALVYTLRSRPGSRAIYDSIPRRFKRTVRPDINGDVVEFFDYNANDDWDPLVDREVQYLVDSWGNPLEYFNVRAFGETEVPSTHGWAAQRLVLANGNQPVIASYGLDGDVQIEAGDTLQEEVLRNVFMGVTPEAFTSPFQEDNIYNNDINQRVREVPSS